MFGKSELDTDLRLLLWTTAFSSSVYLAFSILSVNYLTACFSAFAASRLGFPVSFSVAGISSLAGTTGWCASYIAYVFTSAPIISLCTYVVVIPLFYAIPGKYINIRLFLVQLALAGFLVYYSHVLAGLFYQYGNIPRFFMGFIALLTWLRLEEVTINGILWLMAVMSPSLSLLFVPMLTRVSPSQKLLQNPTLRIALVSTVVIVPVIFGFILVAVSTAPSNVDYHFLQVVSAIPFLVLIVMLLSVYNTSGIRLVRSSYTTSDIMIQVSQIAVLVILGRALLICPISLS